VKCQPGNTQNGGTIIPIVNLMAASESGSPDSYLSLLVTIRLSRLVSEIFTYDRQTDGWTMQTITIAGPHIVVGLLIMQRQKTNENMRRKSPRLNDLKSITVQNTQQNPTTNT